MKISVLTIRDKKTKELIHAQGAMDGAGEYYPQIDFKPEWFTDQQKETVLKNGAWTFSKYAGAYHFDEEVRHIEDRNFEKIIIAHEDIEIK